MINTGYVLGHIVEANLRDLCSRYGYYHFGGAIGPYHQFWLMLSVAKDMERICPNAWLIQVGNPVFHGSTLMTRETSIKVIGLCHGHYGYREIADVLGLDPDKVVYEEPGLNHNIWLTNFEYEGQDMYPVLDEWIATQGEEYWRTHRARSTHDAQMSRGAINEYRLYGLMPIGDTVRRGGWWYHTDIITKKRWFGEPYGGPDTHIARPFFVKNLEKNVKKMIEPPMIPQANLLEAFGSTKTREQIVPIIDALSFNNAGEFQVNVPNKGGKLQRHPGKCGGGSAGDDRSKPACTSRTSARCRPRSCSTTSTPNGWRWSAIFTPSRPAIRACCSGSCSANTAPRITTRPWRCWMNCSAIPACAKWKSSRSSRPDEYIANFFNHNKPMIS